MDREDIVSEVAKVWDRRAMEDELTHASIKIMAQHVEIERLRAALGGMLRAVCGHDGFAAAIRQTSGMMYPWPALDAAEREARAALAQEKKG
jgi:hypothetical protein